MKPGPAPLASVAAALAAVGAATGLTGVLTGGQWPVFVIVTVAVVAGAGVALRSGRASWPLVVLGQLAALVGLLTAVFARSGVLVVIPGPDAVAELRLVLTAAAAQVRGGIPPVPETTELLCLVVLCVGLVAVAVDALAVTAGAPAATGLVLLCVVAVPASLADRLLPWWTFTLAALGFALLLTVDGQRRHLVWGEPAGPGGSAGAAPAAAAVGAGALALALLAGSGLTAVGTEGRIPGAGVGTGVGASGIGLNPFTSLRGQLDNGEVVELFRVRGLTEQSYLRALTLSTFAPGIGWVRGPLDGTAPAEGTVPLPPGLSVPLPGPAVDVQIEPLDYVDTWLPAFGVPLSFRGVGRDWRYDPAALTAFTDRRQRAEPYTVQSVLPRPDAATLRAVADPAEGMGLEFLDTAGLDPRVGELASQVAEGAASPFDATLALHEFFTGPAGGFRYELQTAPGSSGDALVDFLFEVRAGYCEQYASAMAVMLRTLGVPARVAVGFTPGISTGDSHLITTEDAHAWVEAWFPGAGWLPFDPTPLADGRTVVPPYVVETTLPPDLPVPTGQDVPAPVADPATEQGVDAAAGGGPDGGPGPGGVVGAGGVLVLALVAGLTPAALRTVRRRQRIAAVEAGGPGAATAAWEEVLAESRDRGADPADSGSVRAVARALAREHSLDEPGRSGLRSLVGAVERSWYGRDAAAELDLTAALAEVRASLTRCSPAGRRARLLPRPVLPRRRWNS